MQGFKKGCGPKPQMLADGGMVKDNPSLVSRIASVFSPATAQRKSRLEQAEAQATGFQPQAQQAPRQEKPEPKPFRFANGGPVRGPGTGTSDSIPKKVKPGSYIMPADSTEQIGEESLGGMGFHPGKKVPVQLSDGEYELPPEQVHAIGVQALDQMKNATHMPVNEQAQGFAPQQKPEQFFADGGEVDPTKRKPTSPSNTFPHSHNPPTIAQVYGSKPPAQGFTPPSTSPSALYMQDRGQEFKGQIDAGNYAGAAGTALRAGTQGLGMYALEGAGAIVNPPLEAAGRFVGGVLGTDDAAGMVKPAAAATLPAPGAAAKPVATPPAAPAPQATAATPAAGAPAETQGGTINVKRQANGVMEFSGTDVGAGSVQYAGNSGFTPRGGTVNSIPAANFMGASPAVSGELGAARAAAAARGDWDGVRKSYQTGGGTFNGETALATSIRETQQAMSGAKGRQRAALAQQLAALQSQQTGDAEAKSRDAQTQISRDKLEMEKTAQGFQTRSAQRLENLYAKYEAATKPEEKAAIAEQLRVLTGKGGDEWQSVALQGATDINGNKTEGVLAAVNKRTGEMRRFDQGQQGAATNGGAQKLPEPKSKTEYDSLPKGTQYTRNGVTYTKA